jgi:hypothetical protein
VLTFASYDLHVQQLLDTVRRLAQALTEAGVEYRVIGGVAVFLHVQERDPLAARSTRDVDIAVDRAQLERIAGAVRPFGFTYRHAAGVDMLVDAREPSARSAVQLVFGHEKVRPEYVEHIQDLDAVGLITPAVEATLSAVLRDRLREVRASE